MFNEDIIKACLQNKRKAQRQLYDQHKDRLMSILYRYSRNIQLSQDLLQETFIIIFTKLELFKPEKGNFASWSGRIAINQFLQYKRKQKDRLHLDSVVLPSGSAVFNPIIEQMTVEELRLAITILDETHRVILNLYYFEEFDHSEISIMLGIKESSSRSRLTRAKKVLAENWESLNLKKIG